jgi:hypothetical protein
MKHILMIMQTECQCDENAKILISVGALAVRPLEPGRQPRVVTGMNEAQETIR